ncbi:carbonate dehydratase [Massilia sp. KIM]|uniref:carbonic anhydrase n=1 Tax=Massilia sp. KIM TaxID=1955422 RepID=UPI00098FED3B|nr:carbonic anhydrase family protein [Massilia sp. KIM]OON62235.1 carbonate dehydratase [Massilia sp. KIM]
MKRTTLSLMLSACAVSIFAATGAQAAEPAHWDYGSKAGPAHWAELEQDFAACKLGKTQSPIDIRATHAAKLAPLDFHYGLTPAEIVNNGHTVQVNLEHGGSLGLPSGDYKLVQFHFHTPSEEKINGKNYPMVAHLVHKSDSGELAVVAVLFKQGKENAALKEVFAGLPAAAGEKHALEGGIDLAGVLPKQHAYYSYIGSLTTPPCSEGVHWQILKQPVEVSKAQLAAFRKLYTMNARPVQPLNGRVVDAVN